MKSIEKSGYLTNCRAKSTYPLSYRHWFQTTASNFLNDQGRMKTFSLLQPLSPCRLTVLSINYGQWHRYEIADVAVAVADVVVKVPANKSHPVVVDTGWFETFVEAQRKTYTHSLGTKQCHCHQQSIDIVGVGQSVHSQSIWRCSVAFFLSLSPGHVHCISTKRLHWRSDTFQVRLCAVSVR